MDRLELEGAVAGVVQDPLLVGPAEVTVKRWFGAWVHACTMGVAELLVLASAMSTQWAGASATWMDCVVASVG